MERISRSRRPGRLAVALLGLCCAMRVLAAPAEGPNPALPRGFVLPKGVQVPNDTALAIYFPPTALQARTYVTGFGLWAEPGRALEETRTDLAPKLFTRVIAAGPGASGNYGLLITAHPAWSFERGNVKLEVRYRVFDPAGTLLREGVQSQLVNINASGTLGGFRVAAHKTLQLVLADVLKELRPADERYPARGDVAAVAPQTLVNHERPVSTGTGFVLNGSGQMLTAAHVLRDCMLVEAQKDGQVFAVTPRAVSDLIDVAVVDSGRPFASALPLRTGQSLTLGEGLTNVGYPLQGLLAATPNITRGNVSARAGMKGSVGLFQFSAPIQPGSSGGPVVSDGGELLGVTVSTLNVAALAREGLLPQNVNFALDARPIAQFLHRHNVEFVERAARADGSMQVANDAALAAVAQLSCFQ